MKRSSISCVDTNRPCYGNVRTRNSGLHFVMYHHYLPAGEMRKFTVNGTFIPQDSTGNDMCLLFMKYSRCRFKTKCKKSHWIPPLPDEPYPVELKPPLPIDNRIDEEQNSNVENIHALSNNSYNLTELSENIPVHYHSPTGHSDQPHSGANVSKCVENCVAPKRFKFIFHDNATFKCSGIEKLFHEAGVYFDNVSQKVVTSQPVRNKIEKHRLKVLRRINWRNTQNLKEKLSQHPPSFNLRFDRKKIDFTRLRPYVYVLIHECMCDDGEMKAVKPSSFEYLIADTLLAFLESSHCITPQEAEKKLKQWGARAVRARLCIAHLWYILGMSSNSSHGCAKEILKIEENVLNGVRTSLDYACARAFALERAKVNAGRKDNLQMPWEINTSVRKGLEINRARKRDCKVLGRSLSDTDAENANEQSCEKHETKSCEDENQNTKHAGNVTARKRRRRSKRFKNVLFNERKKFKERCTEFLAML